MRGVAGAVLQVLAWLFVANICMCSKVHHQNGCYKSDVILACSNYDQNKPGKLVWRFKDKTAGEWTDLARITRDGKRDVFPHNSTLDERITIHPNGSLGITSLHPDDETMYQCKAYVQGLGLRVHVTDLKVSCGKVTRVDYQVCADDDVMLECAAKHRTNPRKLHQLKWHKKNTDVSWSLLVTSSGSNVTVGDGFTLHGNGSLQLHGGRAKKVVIYKCDVTKNVQSRFDRHIIVVKSVVCRREKRETPGSVKTTVGRVAMTTPTAMTTPVAVIMETVTPSVSSAVSPVHVTNHVSLVSVIISWLLPYLRVTSWPSC